MEVTLKFIFEAGNLVRIEAVQPSQPNPTQYSIVVNGVELLTAREKEVWVMLAKGQSVKEIAIELNLSTKTVEAHKFNLMQKLDVHCRATLTLAAVKHGIIEIV